MRYLAMPGFDRIGAFLDPWGALPSAQQHVDRFAAGERAGVLRGSASFSIPDRAKSDNPLQIHL
jgi:hypothetical protein